MRPEKFTQINGDLLSELLAICKDDPRFLEYLLSEGGIATESQLVALAIKYHGYDIEAVKIIAGFNGKEESKPSNPRKITQIAIEPRPDAFNDKARVIALCNDNTVWRLQESKGEWVRLPDIPQDSGAKEKVNNQNINGITVPKFLTPADFNESELRNVWCVEFSSPTGVAEVCMSIANPSHYYRVINGTVFATKLEAERMYSALTSFKPQEN